MTPALREKMLVPGARVIRTASGGRGTTVATDGDRVIVRWDNATIYDLRVTEVVPDPSDPSTLDRLRRIVAGARGMDVSGGATFRWDRYRKLWALSTSDERAYFGSVAGFDKYPLAADGASEVSKGGVVPALSGVTDPVAALWAIADAVIR